MKRLFILAIGILWPLSQVLAQNPLENCQTLWLQGATGYKIGANVMVSEDIDNDGMPELIADCEAGNWYVMKYNEATQEYDMVWASYYYQYGETVTTLNVVDSDNDGNLEMVAGFQDGMVRIFDADTKYLEFQGNLGHDYPVLKTLFADADNDNAGELLVLTINDTYLYTAATYRDDQTFHIYARDVDCGDIIQGDGNELVYSNGDVVRIQNGSMETLWHFYDQTPNFRELKLENTDTDDLLEIILCEALYVNVYDANTQQLKWTHPGTGYKSIYTLDINGDGKSEIFTYCDNTSQLACLVPDDGVQSWSHTYSDGIGVFVINDLDSDGELEVCRSERSGNILPDHMHIDNMLTFNEEWISICPDPFFTEVNVTDVDDDGDAEIITLSRSSDSENGGAILTIYDAETRALEWQATPQTFVGSGPEGIYGFETGDVDNDGFTEIILAGDIDGVGVIWVMGGASHLLEEIHTCNGLGWFYKFSLDDIDVDGELEYFIKGDYYYILDASDYTLEWTNAPGINSGQFTAPVINHNQEKLEYSLSSETSIMNGLFDLKTGNIDSDPALEIVIDAYRKLHIIDGISHEIYTNDDFWPESIDLYDMNNDGIKEVIVGTCQETICIIDGQSYSIEWLPFDYPVIQGITVADIQGDSEPEILFMTGGEMFGTTLTEEIFMSPSISSQILQWPGETNITVSDYNNDGTPEVFVGGYLQVLQVDYSCFLNGPVSAKDISVLSPIAMYPNPANDVMVLELNEKTNPAAYAEIYNLQGQLVKYIKLDQNQNVINISSLSSGVYLVHVSTNNSSEVQKLVIAR